MSTFELGFSSGYFQEITEFESHRHNDIELNFLMSGEVTYSFAGNEIRILANQLAVFWAAIPHRLIQTAPSTQFYWVTIPLSLFMNWDLPYNLSKAILNGQFALDESRQYVDLDCLLIPQWHQDIFGSHRTTSETVLLEIQARLRRLARSFAGDIVMPIHHQKSNSQNESNPAYQIVHCIAQHYTEPLSCRKIAHAVGIHPAYASRIFKETFDIGIIDYLTQYRVAAAQKLLLTTDLPARYIGMEVGFGSSSRFYAAFKKFCGLPPEKYRSKLL